MRAIRQHAFGEAEELRLETVPDPTPGPGQVRIAVAAAGVHLIDTRIRAGNPGGSFPLPELPMTPGRDAAGVVDAVGDGVDEGWLGRPVVAYLGPAGGGYAELALAPAGALHELPADVDPADAVAMIGTGRTAVAILDASDLAPDDAVLVLSAAGGLGSLLVQAGRTRAGLVLGAAGGPHKVARVRELGVEAIDYLAPDWQDAATAALGGRDLTVVLDGVGGAVGRGALELLAPAGRHVLFGASAGEPTKVDATDILGRGLTVTGAIGARILRRPDGLRPLEERALAALAAGEWTPLVTTFPLAEAAAAHRALENRATVGKVVLLP